VADYIIGGLVGLAFFCVALLPRISDFI